MKPLLLLLLTAFVGIAEIIPADRLAPWSSAGVSGGIPTNRTTIYTTISAYDGTAAAINTAIDNCPSGQVVKLGVGTFNLTTSIDTQGGNSNKTLRGSGSDPATGTKIISDGGTALMLVRSVFNEGSLATEADITSNIAKGDTTITLSGGVPSWVTVGELIGIDQVNDEVLDSTDTHREGAGIYRNRVCCGSNGARGRGESAKVVSKTSTTITVELPILSPYITAQTPQIFKPAYDEGTNTTLKSFGVEDLYIEGFQSGNANVISMSNTDGCWLKNVRTKKVPGGCHVITEFAYRCEIRDSWFDDGFQFGAGQAYGVALYDLSCYNKIENNICTNLHVSMQVNYGSSGNVFTFNYLGLGNHSTANEEPAINVHGNSAQYNVFEGNFCEAKAMFDCIHGSSSHNVLFRNRIVGHIAGKTNNQIAVDLDYWNKQCSVVGNILGESGYHTIYTRQAPTSGAQTDKSVFSLGYVNAYGYDASFYHTLAQLDPIIHANYDFVNNASQYDGGIADHTVPASLVYGSRPAFLVGTGLPWPSFDPGIPGSIAKEQIPAGYFHTNGSYPTGTDPGSQAPTQPGRPASRAGGFLGGF